MLRRILIAAVALVLLAVVGLFLLAQYALSPDSVRATLEQQLSAHFGTPVHIQSARATIFPRVALRLEGLTIGEPAEVTADELSIATGVRGLFSRRVENAEIVLSDGRLALPAALALARPPTGTVAGDSDGSLIIASIRVISLRNVQVVAGKAALTVDLESSLDGDRLEISRLTAQSEKTQLQATGAFTSLDNLQGAFDVTADPLDLDELLAFASTATNTASDGDGTRRRQAAVPMQIALAVKSPAGRFAGYEFADLSTKADVTPARVLLSDLSLAMFGGAFDGALTVDSSAATPRLQLRGQLAGIDVSQLATHAGAAGSITGQLGGTVTLTTRGTDAGAMLRDVRGNASAAILDGVIPHLDMVRTIVLAFGKPSGAPPEGSGSAFSRLAGDFTLGNGVLRTDNLTMTSRDFDMLGRATVAIPGGALDADAQVILSEELTAQAGTDLRRYAQEDGRVILPARIGGSINDPSVTLDLSAAARRALENELKRKAKSFLEGLFKRKK